MVSTPDGSAILSLSPTGESAAGRHHDQHNGCQQDRHAQPAAPDFVIMTSEYTTISTSPAKPQASARFWMKVEVIQAAPH